MNLCPSDYWPNLFAKVANKVVYHFPSPKFETKYVGKLVDLYLAKRPSSKAESGEYDVFACNNFSTLNPECLYCDARATGHNSLKAMLKAMCPESGIPFGDRSNHILY